MTKKTPPSRPTDAELAILGVLWEQGPLTVREIHEELEPSRSTGYTTVLKLLQIMTEKGLVSRDESQRSHVYRALVEQRPIQKQLVKDLMEKAFAGSASELVMSALSDRPSTEEELSKIRAVLDEMERKRGRK